MLGPDDSSAARREREMQRRSDKMFDGVATILVPCSMRQGRALRLEHTRVPHHTRMLYLHRNAIDQTRATPYAHVACHTSNHVAAPV